MFHLSGSCQRHFWWLDTFLYQQRGRSHGSQDYQLVLILSALKIDSNYLSLVFSLVSSVAMVHACREAMRMLKKTGTDFSTARGMDPKQFFEVMGESVRVRRRDEILIHSLRVERDRGI